jgi:hypothetical protein
MFRGNNGTNWYKKLNENTMSSEVKYRITLVSHAEGRKMHKEARNE